MRSRRVRLGVAVVLSGVVAWALLAKLNTRCAFPAEHALSSILTEVRFSNTPLDEAVATLARLGGTKIVIDRPALQAAKIDPATRIDLRLANVSLDQALTQVLGYAGSGQAMPLVYALHEEAIVVTTAGGADRYEYARVYEVGGIVVQPPEAVGQWHDSRGCFATPPYAEPAMSRAEKDEYVRSLIDETLMPYVADVPAGGVLYVLDGRLLVVAGSHYHHQVQGLLDQVRRPLPPTRR